MTVGMLQLLHGKFRSDDVYIVYVWTCSREEVLRHAAAAAAAVWSGPAERRRGSSPPSHDVLFERQRRGKESKGGRGENDRSLVPRRSWQTPQTVTHKTADFQTAVSSKKKEDFVCVCAHVCLSVCASVRAR